MSAAARTPPALLVAIALAILLALGTWQVQRMSWKQEIIDTIEERIVAPAVPLPAGEAIDPEAWEYRRVLVRGEFLHDREIHLAGHTRRGNLGYQVVTPMRREQGGHVLVNRGWVPAEVKDAASRPESLPQGPVTVEGVVRKGWEQTMFVPDNDPVRNYWFYADLDAMARAAGVSVPPVMVEAVAGPDPAVLPIGGQTRLEIPNNHLQYALTWYGLAVALVAMYLVAWRKRRHPKL